MSVLLSWSLLLNIGKIQKCSYIRVILYSTDIMMALNWDPKASERILRKYLTPPFPLVAIRCDPIIAKSDIKLTLNLNYRGEDMVIIIADTPRGRASCFTIDYIRSLIKNANCTILQTKTKADTMKFDKKIKTNRSNLMFTFI